MSITFNAGYRAEFGSKYPKGIAHFMEHCRFLGAGGKSAKELSQEIAYIGGSWNAFTSNNIVNFHVTVPELNVEKACEIMSNIVIAPDFPEKEVEREKGVVCQEIRMYNDDMDFLVNSKLYSGVFDNSLSEPICGTEESVMAITKNDLLSFDGEFYRPEHMLIVLAAPNDYEHTITKFFGNHDGKFIKQAKAKSIKYADPFSVRVFKEGQIQDTISVCYGNNKVFDLFDKKHSIKVEAFNAIFGSSEVSRLFGKVRQDLGLVYGIYSVMADYYDGSLFGIDTLTDPGNSQKVLDAIENEISKITTEQPTQYELDMAKNKLRSKMYRSMDSSSGIVTKVMGEILFDVGSAEEVLAAIDQVTTQDVLDVAKIIFSGNRYEVIGSSPK